MAEETKSNEKKAKKRTNKLTNARIKKEIEFLTPMFAGIDDEDKKSLVNSLVEEGSRRERVPGNKERGRSSQRSDCREMGQRRGQKEPPYRRRVQLQSRPGPGKCLTERHRRRNKERGRSSQGSNCREMGQREREKEPPGSRRV